MPVHIGMAGFEASFPLSHNCNLTETQPLPAYVLLGAWKRADITDTGCHGNWRMNFGMPTRCLARFATLCLIAKEKPTPHSKIYRLSTASRWATQLNLRNLSPRSAGFLPPAKPRRTLAFTVGATGSTGCNRHFTCVIHNLQPAVHAGDVKTKTRRTFLFAALDFGQSDFRTPAAF